MSAFTKTLHVLLKTGLTLGVLGLGLVTSGCWNDDCDPACDPGYACYYGACLSKGFCPANDINADTCAEYGESGECLQRVTHGICNEGFVCECQEFGADGRCTSRECVRLPD